VSPRAAERTAITEIVTGLGALGGDLAALLERPPQEFVNVPDAVWSTLRAAHDGGGLGLLFERAFDGGAASRDASAGLRGRPPALIEWKGLHRPPGPDVMPVDLRLDHVYQISCKYDSQIMQNAGPARLFDRLLADDVRDGADWFGIVAPLQYQRFYDAVRDHIGDSGLPVDITGLDRTTRRVIREALRARVLPAAIRPAWTDLCAEVASQSAARWARQLSNRRAQTRLLWRLLRIGAAPYFVLGARGLVPIRLRVASAWDWLQHFELEQFNVSTREAGQPEVSWQADVLRRLDGDRVDVRGHVEVRWSHGRLQGAPEAKIYLDTPHVNVPGFFPLD